MNYHKSTDRMNITIHEQGKYIFVQQKWLYTWLTGAGASSWKAAEKADFHNDVDKLIWSKWSGHYKLNVLGSSKFATDNKNNQFVVNFDIRKVNTDHHWNVNVTKILAGKSLTSHVNWSAREISLDTEDVNLRKGTDVHGRSIKQYPAVHEFGHAIGNSKHAYAGGHGDEYKTTSSYFSDADSIMNVRNKLRDRHIDYLIKELNTIIPDTTFSVNSIV